MDVECSLGKGRIIFELYPERAPLACDNFVSLSNGTVAEDGGKVGYKNSDIHRIVAPEFIVQGGDIGTSIYGKPFALESPGWCDMAKGGYLCMANKGSEDTNSNLSQWFVTLDSFPHLSEGHTVFGCVVEGLGYLKALGDLMVDKEYRPVEAVRVVRCGELKWQTSEQPAERAEAETQAAEPAEPTESCRSDTQSRRISRSRDRSSDRHRDRRRERSRSRSRERRRRKDRYRERSRSRDRERDGRHRKHRSRSDRDDAKNISTDKDHQSSPPMDRSYLRFREDLHKQLSSTDGKEAQPRPRRPSASSDTHDSTIRKGRGRFKYGASRVGTGSEQRKGTLNYGRLERPNSRQ